MKLSRKKTNFIEDCSINISNIGDLGQCLNSSYNYSIGSSFENSMNVVTDLYDKENINCRQFNYFGFSNKVK